MVETLRDRLTEAPQWARTDRIFEILGAGLLAGPADRAPASVHLLSRTLPRLRVEPRGRGCSAGPRSTRASTSSSRGGSIPTWTTRLIVTITRRCRPRGPRFRGARLRDRVRAAVLDASDAVADRAATHLMAAQRARLRDDRGARADAPGDAAVHDAAAAARARRSGRAGCPAYVLGPGRPAVGSDVPGRIVKLGARIDDVAFGWDNEFSALEMLVPAFSHRRDAGDEHAVPRIRRGRRLSASRSVEPDDWQWAGSRLEHPVVWERHGGRWIYRTIFERCRSRPWGTGLST